MPSLLPGFVSGGAALVSGNPWSGLPYPPMGVKVKVSEVVSGLVYVGVALGLASGGITQTSGGALSSGGLSDGWEMGAGDEYFIPRGRCSGQVNKIYVVVPPAISGTMRIFYDVEAGGT